MSLNIKNPRVHELAKQAARLAHTSQTSVIEEALIQFLRDRGVDVAEAERRARIERMMQMGERFRREEPATREGVSRVEDLYDVETGLPA